MLIAPMIRAEVGLETAVEGLKMGLTELKDKPPGDSVVEAEISVLDELLGRVVDVRDDFQLYKRVREGEPLAAEGEET